MKNFYKHLLVLMNVLFLSITWVNSAVAVPIVMAGSDYFFTAGDGDTSFDFSPAPGPLFSGPFFSLSLSDLGNVIFKGNPTGPEGSDVQVRRVNDADLTTGSDTIDIEIVALSLKSVSPVDIGGNSFNVYVELNTADATGNQNKGQMTIIGSSSGGTFNSFFDVFVDITIENSIGDIGSLAVDLGVLNASGGEWSSTVPTDGRVVVEGGYGDLNANNHTQNVPVDGIDFFVTKALLHEHSTYAAFHKPDPHPIPEPATYLLFGIGIGILSLARRNKYKNA